MVSSIELFLGVNPKSLNPNKQKWHSAFVTIYCSRALLSYFRNTRPRKSHTKIASSPSDITVNVKPQNGFEIDRRSLCQLVKEKNLVQLGEFGGVDGVAKVLKTDTERGILSDVKDDIAQRRKAFGPNTYEKPPTKNFFHFVWEAFKDLTVIILLGCAALSLGFGMKVNGAKEGWIDGFSIFISVFLVIGVSAISNYRQDRQFNQLSRITEHIKNEVFRDGRHRQIPIFDIVVGDIVYLKMGDQVPADGLLLEGQSLQVDESSMTGESDHVEVSHSQNPFLLSGTKVVDGYARMLVTSVGMNTMWGQMMSQISSDSNGQTPLQARLHKLTSLICKVGLTVAFIGIVIFFVRYFTGNTKDENGNKEFNGSKTNIDKVVNTAIAIIRAAFTIQEGLILAVTLTLAYSMKRMMIHKAMVRKPSACETMGSATIICTDKTGTLTTNQMKVTDVWLGEESVAENSLSKIAPYVVELFREGTALNTTGSVYRPSLGSEFEISGSPTEKAILSWAVLELNMDMEDVKKSCTILHVEAFNSQNKRSGVLMKRKADNTMWIHWKGAAEMILAMCSSYYDASGIIKDLGENPRMEFEKIIQGMAASSLRCIAFAHKQVETIELEDSGHDTLQEDGLILLGLVGINDPCRPGVKKTVEACQYAGLDIKMITGDNVFTAKAVATKCGILKPDEDTSSGVVIEGEEFRNYTAEQRTEKVDKIRVMARSSPSDKLLMVDCLKQKGHVVAVIGDGISDAPALKGGDIGLFMETSHGNEVAKESSDIVIKNFGSVVTVLAWGRCIYNNMQKFIQFQLTANLSALVINFVAAISDRQVPLTILPLLWMNLVMDTLAALALAIEEPTDELMEKPPVGRTEPLITNTMWRNLLSQAFYQTAVLVTLQFRGKSIFGVNDKVKDTLIFNTFILCQVFNEFNARKLEKKNLFKGSHRNKLFLAIIAITILLQVLMVEFLKKFADTERLNLGQWVTCVGLAAASLPIDWAVKSIPVPDRLFITYLKYAKRKLTEKFRFRFSGTYNCCHVGVEGSVLTPGRVNTC
ncbi:P-type ATPase [Parasponia andersonii]|uniref:Calcium-transporting ATPase n=1 Tax=Parasponia andersonii TaxID=3476 RepID=A0A2P5E351_PARAD|nr:P-type ATPase [Parasponia andersonii]